MEEIHSIQSSNYFVTIINEDVSNSSLSLQTYRSLARSEILFLWNVIFILCIHGFNKRLVGKENHQRTGLSRWKDSAVCVVASTLLVYLFIFFANDLLFLKIVPKTYAPELQPQMQLGGVGWASASPPRFIRLLCRIVSPTYNTQKRLK